MKKKVMFLLIISMISLSSFCMYPVFAADIYCTKVNGTDTYVDFYGNRYSGWDFGNGYYTYYENGIKVESGWKTISGEWYYFLDGKCLQDTYYFDDNHFYHLDSSGKIDSIDNIDDWKYNNGRWIYVGSDRYKEFMIDGGAHTGAYTAGQYCSLMLEISGYEQLLIINNKNELIAYNNGWVPETETTFLYGRQMSSSNSLNKLKYVSKGIGWTKIPNSFLSFKSNGSQNTGEYNTGDESALKDGWVYFNADGTIKTGWLNDGGNWYFLTPEQGAMVKNSIVNIDNNNYYFYEDGKMANSGMIEGKTVNSDGTLS